MMVRTNHRGPRINGTLQAFNQRHLIDTNWRSANHLVVKKQDGQDDKLGGFGLEISSKVPLRLLIVALYWLCSLPGLTQSQGKARSSKKL